MKKLLIVLFFLLFTAAAYKVCYAIYQLPPCACGCGQGGSCYLNNPDCPNGGRLMNTKQHPRCANGVRCP